MRILLNNLNIKLASVFILLLQQSCLSQIVGAASQRTPDPRTISISTRAEENIRKDVTTIHSVSTITSTLHLATRFEISRIALHKLETALGSDSPDSTPEIDSEVAAVADLDISESISASHIKENEFEQEMLGRLDQSNVTPGDKSHQNVFHLSKGSALFTPTKDITVLVDMAEVHVSGGSAVFILRPKPELVSIYDLHDGSNKKVTVQTADESLSLTPGKHVILSVQPGEFAEINPGRAIPYRKLQQSTWKSGVKVYMTEFPIQSALLRVAPLQNLLLSDKKEDQKLAYQLLKDFVILKDVFGNEEPYKISGKTIPTKTTRISLNLN